MNHRTRTVRAEALCRRIGCLVPLALAWALFASSAIAAKTIVYTVNYPLAYFAERIGGDGITVRFPTPAQIDPAFWKPEPEVIAAYQAADLILLNGAGYAKWVEQASLPRRKLVDTSRSFREAYLPGEQDLLHQHGPTGEHSHGEVAFTTWLDPRQAIAQTRSIEAALVRHRPDDAGGLARRANALVTELEQLDRDLGEVLAGLADEPLLASHPVYSYLARRYALDLRSLTWEPELDPGEANWRALDAMRAERPARLMLWEAPPLASTRTRLEDRGIRVVVFAVVANRPVMGDFVSTMRSNIEVLRHALRREAREALHRPPTEP